MRNLRNNKGSSTPGVDSETMDGMNWQRIQSIQDKIKERRYVWKPVRKILIPKPGKDTKRPLGIPAMEDRIVQEMIRSVLEHIYEPVFKNKHKNVNSGFRSKKGCFHSIDSLKTKAKGMEWCIEGDIKGAYDNVNHSTLINILKEKIADKEFLKLIWDGLKCGAVHKGTYEHSLLGTPQGGIASPILFNIYMSKFDEYILNDINTYINEKNLNEGRKKGTVTRSYKNVHNKMLSLRRKQSNLRDSFKDQAKVEEQKRLETLMLTIPYTDKKKNLIRFVYTRYADDWVFFTNSSESFINEIKDKIEYFFENSLQLQLSQEKTKITNCGTEKVQFLGYTFCTFANSRKITNVKTLGKKRTTGVNLVLGIDQQRLNTRLLTNSFIMRFENTYRGTAKLPWTILKDFEIVQRFNSSVRGLANYYSIITQHSQFRQYMYYLHYSCALTLGRKHKLGLREVFKKYGFDLKVKQPIKPKGKEKVAYKDITHLTSKELYEIMSIQKAKWIKEINKPNKKLASDEMELFEFQEKGGEIGTENIVFSDDFLRPITNWRTVNSMFSPCLICGSIHNIEMHHVKHVSGIGKSITGFAKVIRTLNRKQIAVCKSCHLRIHSGTYDGMSLNQVYDKSRITY